MSRRGGGDRDGRVSVLVKNLPLNVRPDDLRTKFERYGDIRDVYLPRDYHSGRPRGFGFVEFVDQRDADHAIREMDGRQMGGREIQVCLSQEKRKTPREMAVRDDQYRKASPSRRSRSRGRDRRRSRSRDRRRSYTPRRRSRSRSASPRRRRSPSRSRSPRRASRSPRRRSVSPRDRSRSPKDRSPSRSPVRSDDRGRDSRSPAREEYENGADEHEPSDKGMAD